MIIVNNVIIFLCLICEFLLSWLLKYRQFIQSIRNSVSNMKTLYDKQSVNNMSLTPTLSILVLI